MVTSNHIHLLVSGDDGQDVIPKSMQLIAGRTGQEYNQRKKRKGVFWEDRYHATAIESGDHLFRCLVYMDLNMVRAGIIAHPSQWLCSGYNEIQKPRKKNVLINYDKLMELFDTSSYEQTRRYHKEWVDEYIDNGNGREDKWTRSIAVGSKEFVEDVKTELGGLAKGRKAREAGESYQLREPSAAYVSHSGVKNGVIGVENGYFWDINS